MEMWLESIEGILPLWLFSIAVVGVLTIRLARRFDWTALKLCWRDEAGASYSLGWVMTLPFYIVFVGFTYECTMLLVAKTGTVYSSFAGARTAIVWESGTTGSTNTSSKARAAAQQAMVPFGNGTLSKHRNLNAAQGSAKQKEYLAAHKDFGGRASDRFLAAKYADVHESLQVTTTEPQKFDDDIKCRVVYRYRFHVPIVGNILGERGSDGYYFREVVTEAALQNEGPQNANGRLGITFASR